MFGDGYCTILMQLFYHIVGSAMHTEINIISNNAEMQIYSIYGKLVTANMGLMKEFVHSMLDVK